MLCFCVRVWFHTMHCGAQYVELPPWRVRGAPFPDRLGLAEDLAPGTTDWRGPAGSLFLVSGRTKWQPRGPDRTTNTKLRVTVNVNRSATREDHNEQSGQNGSEHRGAPPRTTTHSARTRFAAKAITRWG